jgi:hypothetical protein
VIVVAAAGNYWPFVVYPAGFPECIAVGGSTVDDMNWQYSARNWLGFQIDISAPSEFVRNAAWDGATPTVGSNEGTSFGTAIVAAAAALWLQRFGRNAMIGALGGRASLQALFKEHLRITARVPPGWNGLLDGPGILNLAGLLNPATLPNPATFLDPPWLVTLANAIAAGANLLMQDLFGTGLNGALPRWVGAIFGPRADEVIGDFGAEALKLIMANPLAAGMIQTVEAATHVAEEAAATAANAVGAAAEAAEQAAADAADAAAEAVGNAVDAVADTASDAISTVAGWFS